MVEAKSMKYATMIFLVALFVVVAIMAGSYTYKTYMTSILYSEKGTKEVFACNDFSYNIEDLIYVDGNLTFTLRNTYGDVINTLIVESGDEKRVIDTSMVPAGSQQTFKLDNMKLEKLVVFHPKGCEEYNIKQFKMG
ncbi:hypothetical protein HOK51_00905 [Candidatus Woesearchaeota archaeon]|jgi:hypothetical protein|nr:hypothetical protein [Candidatus Woesearchaeota archaeon]MBT6518374.1 hypothetical protein [Candidatus Woesearchaeota archaeon]MBT7368735.1 hypothetical protein [Candidatus Woesearchaeota archaeon]